MTSARLSIDEFVALARRVIDELPQPFLGWLENVVVDVEVAPSRRMLLDVGLDPAHETLFGLFEGRPITDQEYGEHLPNRIWLFKRPIEEACRSRAEIAYEIRRTVVHELAHHFGYSEEDLEAYEAQHSPFEDDHDDQTPA